LAPSSLFPIIDKEYIYHYRYVAITISPVTTPCIFFDSPLSRLDGSPSPLSGAYSFLLWQSVQFGMTHIDGGIAKQSLQVGFRDKSLAVAVVIVGVEE
jgi:hypothetical protein